MWLRGWGIAVVLGAGCSAPTDEGGGTEAGTTSSATDAPTGGAVSCRFPTFARAETWLRTTDEGNCDKALAMTYGGDCENFHWLGLMGDPWVLVEEDRLRMWYSGGRRVGESEWELGIVEASSQDGVLWTDPKDLAMDVVPVLSGGTPGLDEFGTETVSVVRDPGGGYRMYYTGDRGEAPASLHVIGMATSPDGTVWTKHEAPVLTATLPWEQPFDAGGFMVGGVLEPSVIHEDGVWRMWYQGFGHEGEDPAYARFGHATSTDGVVWTKREEPVFRGQGLGFDEFGVGHTNVVKDPVDGYHLFYVGISADEVLRLGHAWSADGLTWEPNPNNPVIAGEVGAWDEGLVGGPSAVIVDGALRVYYMGTPRSDFSQAVHFALTTADCG